MDRNEIPILPTNRVEFSRCAKAMYANGCNAAGHLLSAIAAKQSAPVAQYDRAASIYRAWLVFNDFPAVSQ